jgi:hypothetical protein
VWASGVVSVLFLFLCEKNHLIIRVYLAIRCRNYNNWCAPWYCCFLFLSLINSTRGSSCFDFFLSGSLMTDCFEHLIFEIWKFRITYDDMNNKFWIFTIRIKSYLWIIDLVINKIHFI